MCDDGLVRHMSIVYFLPSNVVYCAETRIARACETDSETAKNARLIHVRTHAIGAR